MIKETLLALADRLTPLEVEAHCDGPCGVYDPSSARIAAEAVLSMTKKINALEVPNGADRNATIAYHNTLARYVKIKEEQAESVKREILILWSDYFKPEHLKEVPDLHEVFWKTAKLCSQCKVNVSEQHAQELLKSVEKIHEIFWRTKKHEIPWHTAA